MKAVLLSAMILLSGCAMTPEQKVTAKKIAILGAATLIAGAAMSHGDSSKPIGVVPGVGPGPGCSVQPNGSCR